MRTFSGAASLCLWVAGCAAPPPQVTPQLAALATKGTTTDALHRGRAVYTRACTACHATDPPDAFEPERWKTIVTDMAERSHLKPGQQDDLIAYLLAARKWILDGKAPGKPPDS